jgi:ABC-type transporter Mla MlaB component
MPLVIEQTGNSATVKIWAHRLNRGNARLFLRQMRPILSRYTHVMVDINRVIDIDPYGVGSLLTCRHRAEKQDRELTLRQGYDKGDHLFAELFHRAQVFLKTGKSMYI